MPMPEDDDGKAYKCEVQDSKAYFWQPVFLGHFDWDPTYVFSYIHQLWMQM